MPRAVLSDSCERQKKKNQNPAGREMDLPEPPSKLIAPASCEGGCNNDFTTRKSGELG